MISCYVSINSTSYKRSDRSDCTNLGIFKLPDKFPLIPLLIKEAIDDIKLWIDREMGFPLIPLLIKEAIATVVTVFSSGV